MSGGSVRIYADSVNVDGVEALLRPHRVEIAVSRRRKRTIEIVIPDRQLGRLDLQSIDRSEDQRGSRVDVTLRSGFRDILEHVSPAFAQDLRRLEAAVCRDFSLPAKIHRTVHLFYVCPGDDGQRFHSDHGTHSRKYVTLIVPLLGTPGSGGTEFEPKKKSDTPLLLETAALSGSAYAFDGRTVHRGTENRATQCRIFLFVAFYVHSDLNGGDGPHDLP